VVPEDQLSLAIGKRGQNVRLAARLTNWDVDILTPHEFTRSLDTLEETLKTIPDIAEDQVDRLAALGVISVFDIEEVGPEYLAETMGIDEAKAIEVISICGDRAKVVAEEQAKEKAETEARKKAEWEAQQAALAAGGGGIDDILGGAASPATESVAPDSGTSIVDMIEQRQEEAGGDAAAQPVADGAPESLEPGSEPAPAEVAVDDANVSESESKSEG